MSQENILDDAHAPPRTTTLLTLGDGDFSWSVDLASYASSLTVKTKLIATGVDSVKELASKYKNIDFLLHELRRHNNDNRLSVQVFHEVDAVSPERNKPITEADIVIFHHPHLGTEDAKRHAGFLCHLFYAVRESWMKREGHLYITLASGQFERWECERAAKRHGFECVERLQFVTQGIVPNTRYEIRRHQTGKSFRSRTEGSFTFHYVLSSNLSSRQPAIQLPWFQPMQEQPNEDECPIQFAFPCAHCERGFEQERFLLQHVQAKHASSATVAKPHVCTPCNRTFHSLSSLQDHERAKHAGLHTLILPEWSAAVVVPAKDTTTCTAVCSICDVEITTTEEHQQWLRPSPAPCNSCTFCAKPFASRRAQLQHENFCAVRPGAHTS